ncbi:leucine--tRNA ligase, partial [Candidatus Bathyarchaeota archaeon]
MEFLKQVEEKWQKAWEQAKIFEADPEKGKPKCFVTFPYPYMNGPLHMGHAFTATRIDVYARFKRMQGFNVLFPWAWHWTGETIAGASERIKQGDQSFIKPLLEIDGVPEEEIKKFVDPF